MCSHLALGITQDTGHSSDYVGSIIAHELGHNLGMEHDDSEYTMVVGIGQSTINQYTI